MRLRPPHGIVWRAAVHAQPRGTLPDQLANSFASPHSMPSDKDFKRLVRARMTRTGEGHTTARARLLRKRQPHRTPDYTALAGTTLAPRLGR